MYNNIIIPITICLVVSTASLANDTNSIEQVSGQNPFKSLTPEQPEKVVQVPIQPAVFKELQPAPTLYMETAMLKFLSAKSVLPAVTKLLTEYGSVSPDDETNSLVICDSKENVERIIAEIRKVDQTPKQIQVEVVILDVTINDDTEIGVNWADLNLFNGYAQNLSTLTNGGALSIITNNIGVTVRALQKVRNVEILASPRVLVVSGREASISTVEEIPYEELSKSSGGVGSADAITSTQFKTAGITLTVKATITDDGKILMHVKPDQSVDTGSPGLDGRVPIVNRRTADTTLLLEDGQVVAMGGLRRKDTKILHDKIPLLGDLPLIGFLFSNDRTVVTESELLVLISPTVYKEDSKTNQQHRQLFNAMSDSRILRLKENDLNAQKIEQRPVYEIMKEVITAEQ